MTILKNIGDDGFFVSDENNEMLGLPAETGEVPIALTLSLRTIDQLDGVLPGEELPGAERFTSYIGSKCFESNIINWNCCQQNRKDSVRNDGPIQCINKVPPKPEPKQTGHSWCETHLIQPGCNSAG